ncbi:geraniol 8-hydroxylase-like [Silene latifolia]|uniref:geraniol 8-hydroxylase-like n=1 Tax=Silene latifolia TaxID=37657 RepID=UPI003D76F32B
MDLVLMLNLFDKVSTTMEPFTISLVLISVVFVIFFVLKICRNSTKFKLPPGPKAWPIIGNIHQLGDKPHRSVAELSKKYGPIMSLKLGTITTVVISSPELAKEMFLKHDLSFSSRTFPDAARVSNHYKHSMVWLPVGPKWRDLRKIAVVQVFTNHRLDSSQGLRQRKVAELVDHVRHCCETGKVVSVGKAAFSTTLNLLSNTFFSIDLGSHDSSSLQEFKDIVWASMELGAKPNVSDFFPLVRHFDLQGVFKKTSVYFEKMIGVFDRIIGKRLSDGIAVKDDVLGTLLKQVEDNELSLEDLRHLLFDLFVAGTDTTSSTLEWAMTELLRNPEKMAKAQEELDQIIGKNTTTIQESDISKLPYTRAVVKETLRLHPPGPFLVPHKAEKDVQLCGFSIPKDAQIWVNVWSIGRDSSVWPNAQSFLPERFLESEVDFKGQSFELLPFGAGRRMCPGMPLAYRMLHLMLATLLHSFNWKHAHGLSPEDIDMEEKFGITLQKAQPLQAIPLIR